MRSWHGTLVLCVYTLTIFINAFLLFLIQPMFARMILPLFGGSPAVWNVAMVFYQVALLGGYAYAHFSGAWLGERRQAVLHLGLLLLAALALPIRIPASWNPPAAGSPVAGLLALMSVAVGLPFFAVSAGSPLLQKWFAATGHRDSPDPYFLYAAGNLGSMLALVSYPALVEPTLLLRQQGWLWAIGYGVLIIMTGVCALPVWRARPIGENGAPSGLSLEALMDAAPAYRETPGQVNPAIVPAGSPGIESEAAPLTIYQRLRWVLLASVPSSLMLSVTTYLTSDIASVPLLWVIPLAIYLGTFILVFARRPRLRPQWMVKAMPIILMPLVITLVGRSIGPIALVIPLHLAAFFVIAMVCHGELVRGRPLK